MMMRLLTRGGGGCCCSLTSQWWWVIGLSLLWLFLFMASQQSILSRRQQPAIAATKTRAESRISQRPIRKNITQISGFRFFDCHRQDSLCVYFQPRAFFQSGPGRPFLEDYDRLGGNNKNLPACMTLSWNHHHHRHDNETTTSPFDEIPHNITFCHTHKCGGTTVQGTMQALRDTIRKKSLGSSSAVCTLQTYKYSMGGGTKQQKEENRLKRDAHLAAIGHIQKTQGATAFPVFTVVRDPVERFLSAVQQVMHYNTDFRQTCLKRTAKATLLCAITDIRDTAYRRDVHLLPMVTHLRLLDTAAAAADILVSVFHLRDIDAIAQYFVGFMKKKNVNDNDNQKMMIPHWRDRSKVEYATSKVLATMSVQDCDADMLRDICELYAIDVAMLRELKFPTLYCD